MSDLPAPVQAAISTAIGRDQPAYHAVRADGAMQMRTRGDGLTATFRPDEVVVAAGAATWSMRLQAYGRGDALTETRVVEPTTTANRVEYPRDGLTEWYVNGPAGLEQGFTIDARPRGAVP